MIFYPSSIPDPGVKKAPDPASETLKITCVVLKAGFGHFRPQEVLRLQEEWQSRSLELDKARQDLEEQRGRLAADRKAVLWNRNRRNRLTEQEP
jgi:hypothetical protein